MRVLFRLLFLRLFRLSTISSIIERVAGVLLSSITQWIEPMKFLRKTVPFSRTYFFLSIQALSLSVANSRDGSMRSVYQMKVSCIFTEDSLLKSVNHSIKRRLQLQTSIWQTYWNSVSETSESYKKSIGTVVLKLTDTILDNNYFYNNNLAFSFHSDVPK